MSDGGADNVKVAVRVRPFNQREKDRNSKMIVEMVGKTTYLVDPESEKKRDFTFDFSYNSFDSKSSEYASQETVWKDIGEGVLNNAWSGYNCSLFAYGQTGAGKSYSMVGYGEDRGIIPVASDEIFKRIAANEDSNTTFTVEASMLEIYMEKIRDLFNPKAGVNLRVRRHPKTGFFVEDLSLNTVSSYEQVEKLMEMGTKARTVASTAMNATSSRAHTIFQIKLTQTKVDAEAGKATDKTSLINLVDLAGSERQKGTGATGDRLKEGAAINKSLSSLGKVIKALAHNSDPSKKPEKVPYRDSVLTQLLENSLGGNAKTVMIAAISPADINYDETLSTLRYADSAKQIKNKAVVNEDPNEKLIRALREEIENLRKALQGGGGTLPDVSGSDIEAEREKMRKEMEQQKEEELARMRREMEEKIKADLLGESQRAQAETMARAAANDASLAAMGLRDQDDQYVEKLNNVPHIANLHEDPMLSEKIVYFLEDGVESTVGRRDAKGSTHTIALGGLSILENHAKLMNKDGVLTITPESGAKISVNGEAITEATELKHRSRLIFGNNNVYKVVIPSVAKELPEGTKKPSDEPSDVPEVITYDFAMLELNKSQVVALAAEDEIRRKQIEEERARAEAKIRALEAQLQQEREKYKQLLKQADEMPEEERQRFLDDAKIKFDDKERDLMRQMEDTRKHAQRRERELRQRSLLDEKLLRTIPLVNEANAMAEEMTKVQRFEVKLMANQNRSALASTFSNTQNDGNEENEELDTEVYVVVKEPDDKVPDAFWHYDKFMNRLYIMREMYQLFVEADRDMSNNPYQGEEDPFYDPPENQLIGKATIYLDSLLYVLDVDETTPIIDYKGEEKGELQARIIPHLNPQPSTSMLQMTQEDPEGNSNNTEEEDAEEEEDLPEKIEDLKGKRLYITFCIDGARGLPTDLNVGAFVKFRFYLNEKDTKTPDHSFKTINPRFGFHQTFDPVVTDEFIKYIGQESIEFEIWGRYDDGSATVMPASITIGKKGNRRKSIVDATSEYYSQAKNEAATTSSSSNTNGHANTTTTSNTTPTTSSGDDTTTDGGPSTATTTGNVSSSSTASMTSSTPNTTTTTNASSSSSNVSTAPDTSSSTTTTTTTETTTKEVSSTTINKENDKKKETTKTDKQENDDSNKKKETTKTDKQENDDSNKKKETTKTDKNNDSNNSSQKSSRRSSKKNSPRPDPAEARATAEKAAKEAAVTARTKAIAEGKTEEEANEIAADAAAAVMKKHVKSESGSESCVIM